MEQNLPLLHTERIHRSDLCPLSVHHTFHGGCDHKDCNSYKDDHKRIGKCLVLLQLTVKSRQPRYGFPVDHRRIFVVDSFRDRTLMRQRLSIGRPDDHLCIRHHLHKLLVAHLLNQCQKHILRQIIHIHAIFVQLIEHCLIGICVLPDIRRRNLLLLDQVCHILPDWERIVGHICHRDVLQKHVRIPVRLSVFIFYGLDQSADCLCKCHTIVFDRKCIADMQIPFFGKCICNPDTIRIVRVEILSFDKIRCVHFIFFHQEQIHLCSILLGRTRSHLHAKLCLLYKIQIADCLQILT